MRVKKVKIVTKKGVFEGLFKWDQKDKAYLVTVPSLPEVFTFGKNLADAKRMAKDAVELYCDCLVDDNKIVIDDQKKVIGKIPHSRIISLVK